MNFSLTKAAIFVLAIFFVVVNISSSVSASSIVLCPGSSNNCWAPAGECPLLPEITINYPMDDYLYNTNKVPIDVQVQEQVQEMKIISPYSETLCTNCQSYQGLSRDLTDGSYQFCIKVTTTPKGPCQGGSYYPFTVTKCVHFEVSTKRLPIILDYNPKDNSVITGANNEAFWIRYNESQLKNASLIFRKIGEDTYYILTKTDCPSGSNAECTINVDLSAYKNLDKIEFYFRLINILGGVEFSNHSTATIVRTLSSFEILSPVEGNVYASTTVPLDVWVNGTVKYIKKSLDGVSYTTLCSDCSRYNGTITAGEGSHSLKIQLTDYSSNSVGRTVNFKVDSKAPVISSQTPANNAYALENTLFTVQYTEDYLKEIMLYIIRDVGKPNESVEEYLLDGCPSGTSKSCSKTINVSTYEPMLKYYFKVSDYLRNAVSNTYTINIDSTSPTINLISPESKNYESKVINLELNTNGEIMKTIKYSADSSSYTTLCSNCNSYSAQKSFSDGQHQISIMAIDFADNNATATASFFIDSILPQIISLTPANKTYMSYPDFSVKYTETNIDKVMLYWKGSEEEWQATFLSNCPSGSYKLCYSPTFLIPYFSFYPEHTPIEFFFRVFDPLRDVNSTVNTMFYDSTAPQISILSPLDNTSYSQTTVQINVGTHEKCKYIKYAIDGASYSTMCYDCSSYTTSKSLSRAAHTLSIRAEDYAGNIATKAIMFTIN